MAGLIGVGQQYKNQAKQGLQQASSLEQGREIAGDNIKQAEKGMRMSAVGTGAGIGMMAGGPVGALIGAGVGLLASELF